MIGSREVNKSFKKFIQSCDDYVKDIIELFNLSELTGDFKEVKREIIYNDKYVKRGLPLEKDSNGHYLENNLFIYYPLIPVTETYYDEDAVNEAIEKYGLNVSNDDSINENGVPNSFYADYIDDKVLEDIIISNYGHKEVKQKSEELYKYLCLFKETFDIQLISDYIYKLKVLNEYTCLKEIPEFESVIKFIFKLISNSEQLLTGQLNPIDASKTQKIMLMFELGIFDYLVKTCPELKINGTVNNTKLAQIISTFTELNSETVRRTYEIFIGNKIDTTNPFDVNNNKIWLANTLSELGINKKK